MQAIFLKIVIAIAFCFTLAGSQCQVIHSENFNSCSSISWQAVSGSADEEAKSWSCSFNDQSGYIEINTSVGRVNDDWLISPQIFLGLSEEEFLLFDYHNKFDGSELELYYSADFAGSYTTGAVEQATWMPLDIRALDYEDHKDLYNFSKHPAIPLAGISDEIVHFAFRHRTSGPSKRWRLDNVRILGYYYQDAEASTSTCADFKSELHNLIKGHREIPYTSGSFDVWDAIYTTDRRVDDAGQNEIVWDMYSDAPSGDEAYEYKHGRDNHQGEDIFSEGEFYNREHVAAKAWWGGDTDVSQNTDLHHIVPSDAYVNTLKSAWPLGEVTSTVETTTNGTQLGNYPNGDSDEYVLEPIDQYKGDFARIMFYVAVRYQDIIGDWSSTYWGGQSLLRDSYKVFQNWQLEIFLKWHEQDPVSQKEIDRNNAVFSIQNNRNPFIDHPRWVYRIWGDGIGTACDNVVPTANIVDTPYSVYPNPTSSDLQLDTDTVEDLSFSIISLMGEVQMSGKLDGASIDVSSLACGQYFVLLNDGKNVHRISFMRI